MQIVRDDNCVELPFGKWPGLAFQISADEFDGVTLGVGLLVLQRLQTSDIPIDSRHASSEVAQVQAMSAGPAGDIEDGSMRHDSAGVLSHPVGGHR